MISAVPLRRIIALVYLFSKSVTHNNVELRNALTLLTAGFHNTIAVLECSVLFKRFENQVGRCGQTKMGHKTYKLIIAYRSKTFVVRYWPGGYGRQINGYLTSLSQLREYLSGRVNKPSLDLYCSRGLHLRPLTTSHRLAYELHRLQNQRCLRLVAYPGVKEVSFFKMMSERLRSNLSICDCSCK